MLVNSSRKRDMRASARAKSQARVHWRVGTGLMDEADDEEGDWRDKV